MVQLYDRTEVKEYYKIHNAFIFSWEEIVKFDVLKTEKILEINKVPDRVLINGEEYIYTPPKNDIEYSNIGIIILPKRVIPK